MMKNIFKIAGRVFLILLVITPYILDPMVASASNANTLGELRNELAALKKQKTDNQNSVNNTQSQINNKTQEIATAYANIEQARNDITVAEGEIAAADLTITELEDEIASLMKFYQQINTQESYMEYVTDASSLTELIMRSDAISFMLDYTNNQIVTFENLIVTNEDKKIELINKQEKLNNDITSYEASISSLQNDLASFTEITEDIDDQIKNQEALIDYYENLGCKEDQSLTDCVAIANNVSWLKPLNYGVVTSGFGYRYLWGSYSFHNAVDIGGNWEGTPVYSATNGTVSAVTYRSSCGGNKVYVHSYVNGQPYTVSYLHLLNYNVKVGDKVTTNTVIGTIGGGSQTWWDSCSTGAHLHFGVATGLYLGGGPDGYSSYSTYVARAIEPPGYPGLYGSFYSRTQWFN